MNPWPFITGAYGVAFVAIAGLVIASWVAMRRAEAAADALTRR